MCIVESIKITIKDKYYKTDKDESIILYKKPKNCLAILDCEDIYGRKIKFVDENKIYIKIFNVNNVDAFIIYYEVDDSPIYNQLKEICGC